MCVCVCVSVRVSVCVCESVCVCVSSATAWSDLLSVCCYCDGTVKDLLNISESICTSVVD